MNFTFTSANSIAISDLIVYSVKFCSPLKSLNDLLSVTPESTWVHYSAWLLFQMHYVTLCKTSALCWHHQSCTIHLAAVSQFPSFWWIWNHDLNIYRFLWKYLRRMRLCMQKVYREFKDNKWYIKHRLMWFYWSRNSGNKSPANADNKILHRPSSATRERLNVISHNGHVVFIPDTLTEFYNYFP